MRNVRYLRPEEFVKHGEGTVNFGTAPDGMPWITQIWAPLKGGALLAGAERVFSLREASPDFAGTPLHQIALSLDDLVRRQYSQDIHTPDGGVFHATILPRPLKSLLGDNLLHRLLPPGFGTTVRSITSHFAAAAEGPTVTQFQIGEAFLAFSDKGGTLSVVHMYHDPFGWPNFTFRRSFVQETLAAMAGTSLCFFDVMAQVATELPVSDVKSYLDMRTEFPAGELAFSGPTEVTR